MKFSKQEQRLLFFTGIFLAIFLFYNILYLPISRRVDGIAQKIKMLSYELDVAVSKVQALPYLQKAKSKILPKQSQLAKIFAYNSATFKKLGIKLVSMTQDTQENIMTIQVSAAGSYDALKQYIKLLKEIGFPVQISNASINIGPQGLAINLTLTSFFAQK